MQVTVLREHNFFLNMVNAGFYVVDNADDQSMYRAIELYPAVVPARPRKVKAMQGEGMDVFDKLVLCMTGSKFQKGLTNRRGRGSGRAAGRSGGRSGRGRVSQASGGERDQLQGDM